MYICIYAYVYVQVRAAPSTYSEEGVLPNSFACALAHGHPHGTTPHKATPHMTTPHMAPSLEGGSAGPPAPQAPAPWRTGPDRAPPPCAHGGRRLTTTTYLLTYLLTYYC